MELPILLKSQFEYGLCDYNTLVAICKWLRDEKHVNVYARMVGMNKYQGICELFRKNKIIKYKCESSKSNAEEAIYETINYILENYE